MFSSTGRRVSTGYGLPSNDRDARHRVEEVAIEGREEAEPVLAGDQRSVLASVT